MATPDSSTESLAYTPAVASATAALYERVRRVIPPVEWPVHAPYIEAIEEIKKRRGAVVLAHNYQTPEIFHGVADLSGDSLALARQAAETDADVIVTTARIFGRPAPITVPASAVAEFKAGSVVVDMNADVGGNCELTSPGEVITTENGVTIVGTTNR